MDAVFGTGRAAGQQQLAGEPEGTPRAGNRGLQADGTTSTANFEVFFLNDPSETAAATRGVDASVKLLEGREVGHLVVLSCLVVFFSCLSSDNCR